MCVLSKGRLFGLTAFDWSVLLGSSSLCLIQPLGVGAGRRRTTTAAPLIYYSVSLKRRRGSTQVKGYRAPSWISGVGCEVLGLERYEAAFRENAIDADVLRDLTDQDLEKLGVLLGDRRRLLRAIAALDGVSAAASSAAPVPSPVTSALISAAAASPTPSTVEVSGERRHVTAMFCDLVDLTGIAAKLDAEEWRGLVEAYLDAASTAVTEWGGRVANKLGDGLIAL